MKLKIVKNLELDNFTISQSGTSKCPLLLLHCQGRHGTLHDSLFDMKVTFVMCVHQIQKTSHLLKTYTPTSNGGVSS